MKENKDIEETLEEEVVKEDILEEDNQQEIEEANDEYKDKYLRLFADYDNLKRRSAQDLLNQNLNTKIEVFKELVEVIDNFERSLTFDSSTEDFKKGIELVHDQLVNKLEKLGLEKVSSEGIMDPNFHQAVMTDTQDDFEDDEIIEELQKGYKVNEKLIRPAMVKVNKK